jgi:(2Fe-2S) ferredoxin
MSKLAKQRIPFEAEGQFLGFLPDKDGKLKYLRWQAGAEVFAGKIPKPLRSELYRSLKPGDRLQIAGEREVDPFEGREKWVLCRVVPVQASPKAAPGAEEGRKGVVLVCQKSDCCRRGAMAVMQALQAHLAAYPETIRVQGVGCMKDCKRGPNVVFLPDKARYSGVSPQGIPALLQRHFPLADPVPSP